MMLVGSDMVETSSLICWSRVRGPAGTRLGLGTALRGGLDREGAFLSSLSSIVSI